MSSTPLLKDHPVTRLAIGAVALLSLSGCLRAIATSALADALSGPGSLGTDDDPELVFTAAPFGLKTMESVLKEQPRHVGLLTSLASGFTQRGGMALARQQNTGSEGQCGNQQQRQAGEQP